MPVLIEIGIEDFPNVRSLMLLIVNRFDGSILLILHSKCLIFFNLFNEWVLKIIEDKYLTKF